jgi:hypothetical protein
MDTHHHIAAQDAVTKTCHLTLGREIYKTRNCEGPRCMAWRWAKLPDVTDEGKIRFDPKYSTTHGYCGLVKE